MPGLLGLVQRALLVSLPNFLTIFVAMGLFCALYPLRAGRWRLLACAGTCLGISFASSLFHTTVTTWAISQFGDFAAAAATIMFFVVVLLACVPIARTVFEVSLWDAVFCCTAGYALQNLAHSLWETLRFLTVPDLPSDNPLSGASQLAVAAVVFLLGYRLLVRRIHTDRLEGEGDRRTLLVLLGVIAVNIVLDTSIRELYDMGALPEEAFLLLMLVQLFICALTLYLDYEILYSNRMRADAAATRQLMADERRQYELSRDTIEAINVRCHDIRHQVHSLSGRSGTGEEFMRSIDGLISIYDSGVQTSNPALDVILTEKGLLCGRKEIELTCSANGSILSFMSEQDVYSLFGNALDNAIDAADAISDPERRLIDVSVRRMGQMAVIQVRNFYEGELRQEGGSLGSTKGGGLHGYGTKSMRLVAERYGGSITFDARDGLFRVHVLLPIPE